MSAIAPQHGQDARYRDQRMSADAFLALTPDGYRYELIDGVVRMSPSASFPHQLIAAEIVIQIGAFLKDHPIGVVATDVDIRFADDRVYRPDVIFLDSGKAARCGDRVTEMPDLIVEVVSPDSRDHDTRVKRTHYAQAGIGEYWVIDPIQEQMTFLQLRAGQFVELTTQRGSFESPALPGFQLDLDRIRRMF